METTARALSDADQYELSAVLEQIPARQRDTLAGALTRACAALVPRTPRSSFAVCPSCCWC